MNESNSSAIELYGQAVNLVHQYDFDGNDPKKLEGALDLFQEVIETDSSIINAYIGIANCRIKRNKKGDLIAAEEVLRKAIALEPTNAYAHLNLGRCLRMGGDLENAISEMEIATSHDPTLYTAHFDLGRHYIEKGNLEPAKKGHFYRKAREHLQEATKCEFEQITSQAKDLVRQIDDILGSVRGENPKP